MQSVDGLDNESEDEGKAISDLKTPCCIMLHYLVLKVIALARQNDVG